MSATQRNTIREEFAGRTLVILLDADAREDAAKLRDQLGSMRRTSLLNEDVATVVIGKLPAEHDPADCTTSQLK